MSERAVNAGCSECESAFYIQYNEMLASTDLPQYCPFCGEYIDEISEDYIEDDEDVLDDETWN